MMKGTNKIKVKPIWLGVAGVAVVGIGLGVYWLTTRKKGQFSIMSSTTKAKPSLYKYTDYPVRLYSTGDYVKPLQCYLNARGATLKVDGKFGPSTLEAAKKYSHQESFDEIFMAGLYQYWDSKTKTCKKR